MKGGILAAFATMGAKLGYMQLVEGEVYRGQARENATRMEYLPAARGLLLDRQGRRLAQNRRSWSVQIVPADLPDAEEEPERRQLVMDTLISALQISDTLVINERAIPPGQLDTVLSRVGRMFGYEDQDLSDLVAVWEEQIDYEILLNVLPNGGLSQDDAARFRASAPELPGVSVMNRLEWLVRNTWNPRVPVVVAQDIPREVALKLEANKMYLPGVELDDKALVRDYVGGESMSHVLGYVSPIPIAMIRDPRWKGENGETIYEQNDVIGREGLELALERRLRGKRGSVIVERDAANVKVRELPGTYEKPQDGENVHLSIDREFQEACGRMLKEQIDAAAAAKAVVNETRVNEGKEPWETSKGGSVVAYDPRNGEILAMVSYPYYDNQLFVNGISRRKWDEYVDEDAGQAFLNRATNEVYPPGSTYKVFLAASALDRGSLDPGQTHVCRGAIRIPNTFDLTQGSNFACWVGWRGGEHGEMDVYSAIEQSCDVYFYNISEEHIQPAGSPDPVFYWDYHLPNSAILSDTKHVFNGLGIDPLVEDVSTKFYFGRSTGIEIGEEPGLVPTPARKVELIGEVWNVADTMNFSIGQGDMTATPLQMAFNTGIIAANGAVRKPRLVRRAEDVAAAEAARAAAQASPVAPTAEPTPTPTEAPAGSPPADGAATPPAAPTAVPTYTPVPPVADTEPDEQLAMSPEALEIVREGMRRVIEGDLGTARANSDQSTKWPRLNPEGEERISVAGKTGTAEMGLADEDTGIRDSHAWFTCYAPIEAPEIAIAVVIDAGGEGSTFAVPVADGVLRAWFELTGKRPRGTVLSPDPMPI